MIYAVTRPLPDGTNNYQQLLNQGYDAMLEPLMMVSFMPWPAHPPDYITNATHFIFTSQNGIRSFATAPYYERYCHIPVFAIGKQTAACAKEHGFTTIYVGGGNIENFIPLFIKHDPQGYLCHIGAHDERIYEQGTLCEQLRQHHINAHKHTCYKAYQATSLQHDAWKNPNNNIIPLIYSPRTARIFVELYIKKSITASIIGFYCLSEQVSMDLLSVIDTPCYIANNPTHQAMLDLLIKKPFEDAL